MTSKVEGDQLYLYIPEHMLDTPMLFVRYEDFKNWHMQVTWSRHGDRILLKQLSIRSSSGITIPFKEKVALMDNVLGIFPVDPERSDETVVCTNITKLVLGRELEWPQYPEGFKGVAFPEISLLLGSRDFDGEVVIGTRQGKLERGSKVSRPVYFGFCALREPMKSRRYDYRMGFWREELTWWPLELENRLANIARWRLEKKYKDQKVSVPVRPITFTLAPEIPKKWRPYIRQGIEDWLPAFEAAGFKDAIVVREVDSLTDWQRHSIHYNIVHWRQRQYFRLKEGRYRGGGTATILTDYRSGEILRGDIHLNAAQHLLEDRYFIRAAPLDQRAQKFPFPDELVGQLYRSLTAHETGHALGIKDSNFGEFAYPFEKMDDADWLEKMGHTPSIMNYTRHNNIPQPEDSIPPSLLIQKVGPADIYTIQWGYTEFPPGIPPEREEAALENIIRWQDSVPWYRYVDGQNEIIGPATTDEVVETDDPVRATEMALNNIRRVIGLIPQACRGQKGHGRLAGLHDMTLDLWYRHMRQVVALIGGYHIHYKSLDQSGNIYDPIEWDTQMEALDFLVENAFNPPSWLVHPEFDAKLRYSSHPDRVLEYQQKLLLELLRAKRMKRFEYMQTLDGYGGVLRSYLTKLQWALFEELKGRPSRVSPRKREIQLTYIARLGSVIQQEPGDIGVGGKAFVYTDYSRGLIMEQLQSLRRHIEKRIERRDNTGSKGHWKLCLQKLDQFL